MVIEIYRSGCLCPAYLRAHPVTGAAHQRDPVQWRPDDPVTTAKSWRNNSVSSTGGSLFSKFHFPGLIHDLLCFPCLQFVSGIAKKYIENSLWQNMEIKQVMSTFSKTFGKQFHFSLTSKVFSSERGRGSYRNIFWDKTIIHLRATFWIIILIQNDFFFKNSTCLTF